MNAFKKLLSVCSEDLFHKNFHKQIQKKNLKTNKNRQTDKGTKFHTIYKLKGKVKQIKNKDRRTLNRACKIGI